MQFIKISTFFAFSLALLVSCVKSKDINFVSQSTPTAHLVDFNNQFESAVFDISNTPSDYTFYAELSSSDNNYPATDITIAKDAALVTSTRTNPSDTTSPFYEFLPDSAYQLVNTTATVDNKTHLAAFQLKINTSKINVSHPYALGFTITSSTGSTTIATNKKSILISIGVKNKYDGIYILHGHMLRAGDAALSGPTGPEEIPMVTYGPSSVLWNAPVPWANGSGSTLPDGYQPVVTVNADNSLSLASVGGIAGWKQTATYNQHYDPATKTFYLEFTWGAGPSARLSTDTLVYEKPR